MAKQTKGDEGSGTGQATRSAIRAKLDQGCSLEEIGRKTNRTGGTISDILSGEIKNPPSGLASQIRGITCEGN